jgi:hypothetical protein
VRLDDSSLTDAPAASGSPSDAPLPAGSCPQRQSALGIAPPPAPCSLMAATAGRSENPDTALNKGAFVALTWGARCVYSALLRRVFRALRAVSRFRAFRGVNRARPPRTGSRGLVTGSLSQVRT